MRTTQRLSKVGLIVGYVGLFVAVVAAHRSPTRRYELSIYAATPGAVWAGLGVALAVAVVVAFVAPRRRREHAGALLLAAASMLTVMAIPILRGYTFYGPGDSLSHLGWAKELANGSLLASNLLYPGMHVASVIVSRIAAVPLSSGMLYVVLWGFPVVFVLFVPLATQLVADTERAFALGLFGAVLFVPLNNIALYPVPHPASQAILFFSFVLFLALSYAVRYGRRTVYADGGGSTERADGGRATRRGGLLARRRLTGIGALLALASLAIVFVHPQQALNAGAFLLGVAGLQFLARRRTRRGQIAAHRSLLLQALFLLGAFGVWSPRFNRVQGAAISTIIEVLRSGPTAGELTQSKAVSLSAVGGSLPVLFVKLFAGAIVFSALASALLGLGVLGRVADRDTRALTREFVAGLVPVLCLFGLFFLASTGDMYFRYEGFAMVPLTVLGTAALALGLGRIDGVPTGQIGRAVVALLVVGLVPMGVLGMHSSPYIYQPSKEVTRGQIDGYETGFAHRQPGVRWVGLRGGPQRYVDVYYGTEYALNRLDFPGYKYGTVNSSTFANASYGTAFGGPRYFSVTRSSYESEVGLYRGFRFPARGFRELETTPGVNRIETGGGVRLYYLRNATRPAAG